MHRVVLCYMYNSLQILLIYLENKARSKIRYIKYDTEINKRIRVLKIIKNFEELLFTR